MNIEYFENLIIPIIVVACFCVGYVVKKWLPTDDRYIPTIVAVLGALLGYILCEKSTTAAIVTGTVAGCFSGLASTGVHQFIKQNFLNDKPYEMTEAEAMDWIESDPSVLDDLEEVEEDE